MALSKAPAVAHVRVDEGSAGQRIDNFLVRVCKGVPKGHIYRILRSGEVRVNSRRVAQTYRLQEGDELRIVVFCDQADHRRMRIAALAGADVGQLTQQIGVMLPGEDRIEFLRHAVTAQAMA